MSIDPSHIPPGLMVSTSPARPSTDRSAILFLDNCSRRCAAFRDREPGAIITHTVSECVAALRYGQWDEVWLDHDLSGETYCDSSRDDCGMEVVRWVLLNLPDVRTFFVHTHNEIAAPAMMLALETAGYRVVRAPFTFCSR